MNDRRAGLLPLSGYRGGIIGIDRFSRHVALA
jgi:hypothetical protein